MQVLNFDQIKSPLAERVIFLGYGEFDEGVRPDPTDISKIIGYSTPIAVKQVSWVTHSITVN